jgi:uroporphyrinogen decarboxylase
MNTRELFLENMRFNTCVRSLKWEYAYWGKTIKNWYDQGLPLNHYPRIPETFINTSASLYTAAWTHRWGSGGQNDEKTSINREGTKKRGGSETKGAALNKNKPEREIPDGLAVWGEATYWPSQGFPLERDVHNYFGFDREVRLVQVEQLFCPAFEVEVLEEDKESMVYIDLDGVKRKLLRKESTIPTAMAWPVTDEKSWKKLKEERLNIKDIKKRFPVNWYDLVRKYNNRDYPLALGGYPLGFFGLPAHLLGYENLFYLYYDQPDLIIEMLNTFTELWLAIWEEVLGDVDIDVLHIFEDVSSGTGSLISPAVIRKFMLPCYRRVTSFFKERGIDVILVDTDGNCNELIPLFLEGGATGLYPMEASAGMDVLAVRKEYPRLQMMGGIPKLEIAKGKDRIDEILEPVAELLKHGGYIPFCDHSVPPGVPWEAFKYYREKLNDIIERN